MSEETDSKYNKLRKRVKFAVGRSRNSRDDVKRETLDSKRESVKGYDNDGQSRRVNDHAPNVDDGSSRRENAGRRVRIKTRSEHFQRGKQSYKAAVFEGGQRVELGVGRHMKSQRRRVSEANDVSYGDEKLNKREYSGRRSVESNTRDTRIRGGKERYNAVSYGNRELNTESYDRKRKRIYADHNPSEIGTFQKNLKTPSRKDFRRTGPSKFRDDTVEDRRTRRGASHDSEQSTWKKSYVGRRKSNQDESIDKRGVKNGRETLKNSNKVKGAESGDGGNRKQFDQSHKKYTAESYEKSAKKKFQVKKSSADDAAIRDSRPKKKKRVIRLDPHDFSNKRMDDVTATMDDSKERKEGADSNKNVDISMNAQFRAIQPSPSILSFVEENLLGRRREIEFRRAGYNIELPVPLDNIPSSESSERARIEEMAFRNKLEFFAAAKISSSFPPPDLAEIAFAGRSNVGKSSLLNALTRQWGVARTSDKPGLTQTINFFKLGTKISLVDLPGYGFAYAKEETKEAWEELVKEYVSTRVGLERVCLLIDTKWGMKQRDHEFIDLMERSKTKYQIILTKTDLSFPIDVARRAMQIEENLAAKKSAVQPVMMISSKTGAGIRSFRSLLGKVARFVKL